MKNLLSRKPKRVRLSAVSEQVHEMKSLCTVKENHKYLDDEQVKNIWDLAMSDSISSDNDIVCAKEDGFVEGFDFIMECDNSSSQHGSPDYDQDNENCLQFESDMFHHYYPTRRSLYNRKQHFTSFIQNYLSFDQGRKIMSNYEQSVCDFIMKEMKPKTSHEFLVMMKMCKLSNVYRFHNYIFLQHNKCKNMTSIGKRVNIEVGDVGRIVFVYLQFESFFHRNNRFDRKNFLSMRFVLGKILLLLGLVSSYDMLDVDLQRPKGKTQLQFHLSVWQKFIDETYVNKIKK